MEGSVLDHNSQQHLQSSSYMQHSTHQGNQLASSSLPVSSAAEHPTSTPLSAQQKHSMGNITDPPPCSFNTCIRQGCPNPAVSNPEWEEEYCSNECVVKHSKDVFSLWVASNQAPAQKLPTGN